jgi:HK97 family phage prohead protease
MTNNGLETKYLASTKASGTDAIVADDGRISGYAAIFDEQDLGYDIIVAGAFKNLPKQLPMFWHHDSSEVIGVWDQISVDEKGLKVSGRLVEGVKRADEVRRLVEANAVGGLSIGYLTEKSSFKNLASGKKVRYLEELTVYEVSLTAIPMMPLAKIDGSKSQVEPAAQVLDFLRNFREERK